MNKAMNEKKRYAVSAVILAFVLAFPHFSAAQDFKFTPGLSFDEQYNDNVYYSRTDEEDDFITNITPSLSMNYNTEVMNLFSYGLVRFRRYASENDLDREDYEFGGRVRYRLSEKLRFLGRMFYIQDYTLESRYNEIPDSAIDDDPIEDTDYIERGIENFLSEREQYKAYASMAYNLTEVSDINLNYNYFRKTYDSEENTDYDTNRIGLEYNYKLKGQKDKVGANLSYKQRDSDTSDTDSYQLGMVWKHRFSETAYLYTNFGGQYSEQTFNNSGQKEDNWNWFGDVRVRIRGESNIIKAGFRQDLNTASDGEAVNVSRLYFDAKQLLSQRFVFEVDGDFYVTRQNDESLSDVDEIYFDITPSFRYLLTENHSIRLAYNYTIEHDRRLDEDKDIERNRVWVSLEFRFPDAW